jgi:adenylate cyclase class 2
VCKVWEEYETQIEDVQNMRAILEGLGYFVAFQYEKYRDRWTFHSCEICLDVLPFGQFVEIEGNENTIYKSARLLGLDIREALTKSYYELNQDYRKARGLCAEDSFVFDTVKRSQLIESGLNF